MQSDEATLRIPGKVHPVRFEAWAIGLLAVAACIAIGIVVLQLSSGVADPSETEVAEAEPPGSAIVARLTGTRECVWSGAQKPEAGAAVQLGQHLDLTSGLAEVTFDSGARIVLEGPALLDADSAWAVTFDEVNDGAIKGAAVGLNSAFDLKGSEITLTDGRWKRALRLDGRTTLSMAVPLMPERGSRTLAFWVRVPPDSTLADAEAMISWPLHHKKSGTVPLLAGWNCDPNQGPLGALRTEFGKTHAVGATPLRDGRWHHIALTLVPLGEVQGRLQVTQYVDGRLEGTTTRPIKVNRAALEANPSDAVWLGRKAGKRNKDKGHFLGDMDELFIADRALVPSEIISLMTQNTLPQSVVADN